MRRSLRSSLEPDALVVFEAASDCDGPRIATLTERGLAFSDHSATGPRLRTGHWHPRQDRSGGYPGTGTDELGFRPRDHDTNISSGRPSLRFPQASGAAGRYPQGRDTPPPQRRAGEIAGEMMAMIKRLTRHVAELARHGTPHGRGWDTLLTSPAHAHRPRHRPDGPRHSSRRTSGVRRARSPSHRLVRRACTARPGERHLARAPVASGAVAARFARRSPSQPSRRRDGFRASLQCATGCARRARREDHPHRPRPPTSCHPPRDGAQREADRDMTRQHSCPNTPATIPLGNHPHSAQSFTRGVRNGSPHLARGLAYRDIWTADSASR